MRDKIIFIALLVTVPFALTSLWVHAGSHRQGMSVSIDDDRGPVTSCDQLRVTYDGREAVTDEQDFTLTKAQVAHLDIRPPRNGGAYVQGGDREDYLIKACKAVRGDRPGTSPERDLKAIHVSVDGNRVTASGPEEENDWIVYFLIQAPRNSAPLDLEAHNGPLGLRDVNGQVEVRTENGPISLRDCPGHIRAHAQNGPIDFTGSAGDLRLEAQNGPIEVRLTGKEWHGAGLEASTENGPLSLRIPDDYASGVHVESRGYSPFTCEARACESARGTWGREHHGISLGNKEAVVRMSTVNGPVSIESARDRD